MSSSLSTAGLRPANGKGRLYLRIPIRWLVFGRAHAALLFVVHERQHGPRFLSGYRQWVEDEDGQRWCRIPNRAFQAATGYGATSIHNATKALVLLEILEVKPDPGWTVLPSGERFQRPNWWRVNEAKLEAYLTALETRPELATKRIAITRFQQALKTAPSPLTTVSPLAPTTLQVERVMSLLSLRCDLWIPHRPRGAFRAGQKPLPPILGVAFRMYGTG